MKEYIFPEIEKEVKTINRHGNITYYIRFETKLRVLIDGYWYKRPMIKSGDFYYLDQDILLNLMNDFIISIYKYQLLSSSVIENHDVLDDNQMSEFARIKELAEKYMI
jgi:hypothetical protein